MWPLQDARAHARDQLRVRISRCTTYWQHTSTCTRCAGAYDKFLNHRARLQRRAATASHTAAKRVLRTCSHSPALPGTPARHALDTALAARAGAARLHKEASRGRTGWQPGLQQRIACRIHLGAQPEWALTRRRTTLTPVPATRRLCTAPVIHERSGLSSRAGCSDGSRASRRPLRPTHGRPRCKVRCGPAVHTTKQDPASTRCVQCAQRMRRSCIRHARRGRAARSRRARLGRCAREAAGAAADGQARGG